MTPMEEVFFEIFRAGYIAALSEEDIHEAWEAWKETFGPNAMVDSEPELEQ